MLSNGGTLAFAAMLSIAVAGSAVWSQRRRVTAPGGAPLDAATAHAVAEAPPETKAPPAPDSPSWWRDPIARDYFKVVGTRWLALVYLDRIDGSWHIERLYD